MANTKSNETRTSEPGRRRFMAVAGVLAGAAALPGGARASVPRRWPDVLGRAAPGLRSAYASELERLVETLRPGFEAGSWYAYRNSDEGAAFYRLEKLCAEHFGIAIDGDAEGNSVQGLIAAAAILEASPSAPGTLEGNDTDIRNWGAVSATWDVIRLARARGFYTPTGDEEWSPDFDENQAHRRELEAHAGRFA